MTQLATNGRLILGIGGGCPAAARRAAPQVLHQLRSYREWTIEAYGRPSGPYAKQITAETLRSSPAYRVLTPEQALALAESPGANSALHLEPLFAGRMLALWERELHPFLPQRSRT